jgi:glycosyltransferase involved in cell wall biosynthesis
MNPRKECWGAHLKPMALPPMPASPLVSVLIANYNYARFLGQALDSVLGQTYKNFEIVVCDDGSTDGSRDVLGIYGQKFRQLQVVLQENKGQSEAMLAAYKASRGEIICFLDSDDIFLPCKLESMVEAFANTPGAGLAVHRLSATDESLQTVRSIPALVGLVSGWKAPELSLKSPYMFSGMPPTSGLSLRRGIADRILPHLQGRKTFADSVIQVSAPIITLIVAIERPLSLYRVHGANSYSLRKFTDADIERMSRVDAELWCAWRSFVMTIAPALPADFPLPPEKGLYVMDYACARIRRDPNSKTVYRDVVSGPWFDALPRPHQWFWRSAVFLPDWLFEKSFNFVYGMGRAKQVISRVILWLRGHRETK